jgi:hypothetical protein
MLFACVCMSYLALLMSHYTIRPRQQLHIHIGHCQAGMRYSSCLFVGQVMSYCTGFDGSFTDTQADQLNIAAQVTCCLCIHWICLCGLWNLPRVDGDDVAPPLFAQVTSYQALSAVSKTHRGN